MRACAGAYPEFVQDSFAQIETYPIVQAPLAQITMYYHITFLDKVQDKEAKLFYINRAAENGWSRNVMVHQLKSKLYEREGKAVTNFTSTLPASQSDLAKEILKDLTSLIFLA